MKFYLIGIKGAGMSALACILADLGHEVSGSDVEETFYTEQSLKIKKIPFFIYNKANLKEDYIYIIGNAATKNEEAIAVINNYRYYLYHQFIDYFFKEIKIAIAGTHGKTTTTAMLTHFMKEKKCNYLIGDGSGGGVIDAQYLIFEACEYQDHFLAYHPDYLIITNIEHDHPDYFLDIESVIQSFAKLASQSKVIIACGDDPNIEKLNKPMITYGFGKNNDYQIKIIAEISGYQIAINNQYFHLPVYGKYMLYNFAACFVLLDLLNIKISKQHLETFVMPKRRMQEFRYRDNIIINDYAHHPTEIKVTLNAIRKKYPMNHLVVIFQPHTYSRTKTFLAEFASSFTDCDELYLAEIFSSAREQSSYQVNELKLRINNAQLLSEEIIKDLQLRKHQVIVIMGAGNIDNILLKKFEND